MGLRENLNRHPAIIAGFAVIALVAAGWFTYRSLPRTNYGTLPTQAFYSADDGKTFFVDDIRKYPPFMTDDGREAVGAVVISCRGGKEPFVTYLWRYTPEARKKLEEALSSGDPAAIGVAESSVELAKELKRPGDTEWVKYTDHLRASPIRTMNCPPGQSDLVFLDP
jgi:hypothetical protein